MARAFFLLAPPFSVTNFTVSVKPHDIIHQTKKTPLKFQNVSMTRCVARGILQRVSRRIPFYFVSLTLVSRGSTVRFSRGAESDSITPCKSDGARELVGKHSEGFLLGVPRIHSGHWYCDNQVFRLT